MRKALIGVLLAVVAAVLVWFLVEDKSAPNTGGGSTSDPSGLPAATAPAVGSSHERRASVSGEPLDGPRGEIAGSRVVRGIVKQRDESLSPLPGAEVVLLRPDRTQPTIGEAEIPEFARPVASCVTLADGAFEFRDVPHGNLIVVARKDGFASDSECAKDDHDSEELIEVALMARSLQRFLVSDVRGRPVTGASLVIASNPPCGEAVTDERGEARLPWSSEYSIHVRAKGFATASVYLAEKLVADEAVRVVLREGLPIAGVVVDSGGRPVAGAAVSVRDGNGTHSIAPATGADGAFAFDGFDLSEGLTKWNLAAESLGLESQEIPVTPGDTGVRIVLRRPGTVRGIVVHADGSPALGAKVWPYERGTVEGRFTMDRLMPGPVELWARVRSPVDPCMELEGHALVELPEGGEVTDVRVVVGAPKDQSFVLVKVVDGERGSDAHVEVFERGVSVGDSWYGGDDAKRDGAVLVKVRKPAGTLVDLAACISPPLTSVPFDARTEKPVATQGGPPFTPVELHLGAPGRIRLKLLDPEGREVRIGPSHVCYPSRGGNSSEMDESGTAPTRAREPFTADICIPGFATKRVEFAPPHPSIREEVVSLERGARVTGRLLREDGVAPTLDVVLHLSPNGDGFHISGLDDSGRFEFESVPFGPADLRVRSTAEGRVVLMHHSVQVGGESVDVGTLRIDGTRTWRGLVVDDAGKGLGGATVAFLDRGDEETAAAMATHPDGTFDVQLPSSVPPRFVVRRAGFATRIVDPAADAPQPVRIALQPAGSVRVRVLRWADAGWGDLEARLPGTSVAWDPHWARGSLETGSVYDDFPAGPVDLVLMTRSGELVKRVDVVAGQVADVVFGE